MMRYSRAQAGNRKWHILVESDSNKRISVCGLVGKLGIATKYFDMKNRHRLCTQCVWKMKKLQVF